MVLEKERDAGERGAQRWRRDVSAGLGRHDIDDRVEPWVQFVDGKKRRFDDFRRQCLFALHEFGEPEGVVLGVFLEAQHR